ncbi:MULTISPECIES: cytochrome oxidase small assembly protein [Undibacterium]|nr:MULTISPECIES: cytochrome oxidase small assembly protein [Undibacterium]MDP1979968.1 cytochrome oxidase small assembly protein [Undibacterium sp.]
MSKQNKPNNFKTAIILFSVALVFFAGVFIKQTWLR